MIVVLQGDALGGGAGLASTGKWVIAEETTISSITSRQHGIKFGFPEAEGMLPAIVSPYIIERIGAENAFICLSSKQAMTGEEANALGLIDELCPRASIEEAIQRVIQKAREGGQMHSYPEIVVPEAGKNLSGYQATVLALITRVVNYLTSDASSRAELVAYTSETHANARSTKESQDSFVQRLAELALKKRIR